MNDQEIFNLYVAQSENVRELWKAKESFVKDINLSIRKGEDYQVTIKTKFLALLYSTWSEAQFTQIVFTPNGFTYSEIKRILRYKKKWYWSSLEVNVGRCNEKSRGYDYKR